MPIRLGSASRLHTAWSASPTSWTMAGWFRLNSAGGMMMSRSRSAGDGSISAFAEGNGSTLTNYTDTTAGGTSDQIASDQNLYNTGAALVPLMMTRDGNVVTLFDPSNTSGRAFNIATGGATMADVSTADTLAFGAWAHNGSVSLHLDQDNDELAAWTLPATATEYAAFAAATKPEDIGDTTFKASMFDVWTLNPGGAGAIADGATYTGLKNGNVLTLTGTTATVSTRAAPVSRVAAPVITGPSGAAGASSITTSAAENQNAAGTWTATNSVSWSLSGTDAADLSIAGGVVTKASGSFDYEAKPSYAFNVDNGSATQAVTLNITNVSEPPLAPTIGTATAGNASASVAFTPPTNTGRPAITGYTATSSPGGLTGTGATSPITVSGLTNGTAYTFVVTATNIDGTGPASAASNSVTPSAGGSSPAPHRSFPLSILNH